MLKEINVIAKIFIRNFLFLKVESIVKVKVSYKREFLKAFSDLRSLSYLIYSPTSYMAPKLYKTRLFKMLIS